MANRFWVGGSANWDSTAGTKWALTSGGAGGQAVPTSSDAVFFDAASGSGATIVSCVGTNAVCASLTTTGYPGSITVASTSDTITAHGNVVVGATTSLSVRYLVFAATASLTVNGSLLQLVTVSTTAGTLTLADNISVRGLIANGGAISPGATTVKINIQTGYLSELSGGTFTNLTVAGGGILYLLGNITVSGTFLTQNADAANRAAIYGSPNGTQRTITLNGTFTKANLDLRDIVGAGTASWDLSAITGFSGDCGGNSGITFTSASTIYFKTAVSTSWSDASKWVTTSGGSTLARIPLVQDTAIFDANSVTAASVTITLDANRIGNMDFTGVLNTPTLAFAYNIREIYGYMILVSGMNWTHTAGQSVTLCSRGTKSINAGGKTCSLALVIDCYSGWNAIDAATTISSTGSITLTSGTFGISVYTLTMLGPFTATGGTLDGAAGSVISSSGAAITIGSGVTISRSPAITFTGALTANATFDGGGKTYYAFTNSTTGAYSVNIVGSNTFTTFTAGANSTTKFTAGTTTTATTWTISGTAGNLRTLGSITAAQHTLAKAGGGTVTANYVSVSYSNATPSATFYDVTGGVNGGNNTGWIFHRPNNLLFGSNF